MTRTATVRRIVVCSLEPWDDVWRRNQYLVDALLREDAGLEVLFVEPSADPLHMLRRGGRGVRRGRGLRVLDGYEGRLWAFEPTKWLPRRLGAEALHDGQRTGIEEEEAEAHPHRGQLHEREAVLDRRGGGQTQSPVEIHVIFHLDLAACEVFTAEK